VVCGNTKSCGCGKYDGFDAYNFPPQELGRKSALIPRNVIEPGSVFGKLTVIEHVGFKPTADGKNKSLYKCYCQCGNTCTVLGNSLKTGETVSCGCIKSIGEQSIEKILKDNKIKYRTEYTPPLLLSQTGRR
jgi:hypothetical protein